jgi:Fe-S-cluster containining protein
MVMLTDADIRRLAEGTGRPWQEFVRLAPEGAITMDKRSPWWLWLRARRYILTLRWKGRACMFLGADNRCTVYEHRPVACREHPFNIEHSATGALLKLTKSRVGRCPNEWDGKLNRRDLVALSRWTDRESEAFTDRLKDWNRQGEGERTRSRFVRFFGLDP